MTCKTPRRSLLLTVLNSICLLFLLAEIPVASADLALLQRSEKSESKPTATDSQPVCKVRLRLLEQRQEGELFVPGLLRILDSAGKNIPLPELLNRGTGINRTPESEATGIHSWSVIPDEIEFNVPQTELTLEAISGLETEL
ncbi:MAG: hypothetical protein KDA74_20990, partial [Planctomycetaceae bacterium]|nr:hypothetical protein [Planctomycetaceae bacterium]